MLRQVLTKPSFAFALCASILASCSATDGADVVAFTGATVIPGDGSAAIANGVVLVSGDVLLAVGSAEDVEVPSGATTVDVSGKTLMPAIVNAHAHLPVGRAERTSLLQHMAYYGSGVVQSLGHDSGEVAFAMHDELVTDGARGLTAGPGITRPEPGRSDVPFWVDTEDDARSAVQDLAGHEVGLIKIWVDDRGGRYEKLTRELYGAVIEEAHANDMRVTAHIFSLEDAKGLLEAGIDAFAHGIRDQDVDDAIVSMWLERPHVVLVPNLPNSGYATDLSFLSGTVPVERLNEMQAAAVDRPDVQERFGIQSRNLNRLNREGIPIAFGTDGSVPWAVHLEMEDMVRSGMTTAEVITAATGASAALLHLDDTGSLTEGKSADFIVLDANPLDDITNTRRIADVYLRGARVDREGISARLLGQTAP